MKKISFVFGTRPEAIKLCPLIQMLRSQPTLRVHVCVTGQHREMLSQVLDTFGVVPDADLALMEPGQTLGTLSSAILGALDAYLTQHKPNMVVVQGDTTSSFCAALSAFYRRIHVAHIEAGLRTGNRYLPFPEETNRVLTSRLANSHFAPMESARQNLLREGIAAADIWVTGNTGIDALHWAIEIIRKAPPWIEGLPATLQPTGARNRPPLVLVTAHRRENQGTRLEGLCRTIEAMGTTLPDVHFVYPVHANPNVRQTVDRLLRSSPRANIHVIEPLSYLEFVAMMDRATLLLTDSGGIQEEAPSLDKPVLLMRDTTERPEAVEAGGVKLVGADPHTIIAEVRTLLTNQAIYRTMAEAANPYGDGRACERIAAVLNERISSPSY